MSSTGRGGAPRMVDDFYETPAWATRSLLRRLGLERQIFARGRSPTVLDPCAGNGAILEVVRAEWPESQLLAFELRAEREAAIRGAMSDNGCFLARDSLTREPWEIHGCSADLVLTNPPFVKDLAFVERALREAPFVAMLLKLSFMASIARLPFHKEHPSSVLPLPRRPSFAASIKCARNNKKERDPCSFAVIQSLRDLRPPACPLCGAKVTVNTTDSADYAWYVWPAIFGRWEPLDVAEDTDGAAPELQEAPLPPGEAQTSPPAAALRGGE